MVAQPAKKLSTFKEIGYDSADWIHLDWEVSSEGAVLKTSVRARFNIVTTPMSRSPKWFLPFTLPD